VDDGEAAKMIKRLMLLVLVGLCGSAHAAVDMSWYLYCDGQHDDGPTIQSKLDNISNPDYLDFTKLAGRNCKVNEGLNWPYHVGYVATGGVLLDFSGAPANTNDIVISGTANYYSVRSMPWEELNILGNGTGIGLLVATPGLSFVRPTIHNTGVDVSLGNNAYGLDFDQPVLYGASNTAFSIPQGLSNTGEQIIVRHGAIFNSTNGLYIGGARVVLDGTSVDGITASPATLNAQCAPGQAAALTVENAHFEEFSDPTGSAWIQITGCNTYSYLDVSHTEFFADAGTSLPLVNNTENWAWGKVADSFFSGFTSVYAAGAGASNVRFCHDTTGGNHAQDDVSSPTGC
jgi:hypothetical protein